MPEPRYKILIGFCSVVPGKQITACVDKFPNMEEQIDGNIICRLWMGFGRNYLKKCRLSKKDFPVWE